MIKGETVSLIVKTETGTDAFGVPVYSEASIGIDNVLICEPTTEDVTDTAIPDGKSLAYVLCIPKGDTHIWEDTYVSIRGEIFQTVGKPMEWIEANVPLQWNKKVKVIRYE